MRLAVDLSNWTTIPTPAEVDGLRAAGVERAIVGCSYGQVGRSQLIALDAGGIDVEAYGWVTHPLNVHLLDRAIAQADGLVDRLWLDCEGPTRGRAPTEVLGDIEGAIAYMRVRRPDWRLGAYSAKWWWGPATGRSNETFGLPLWVAAYRDPAAPLEEHELPGGWDVEDVALWQYAGSSTLAGLNVDLNLILEGDMPTQQEWDQLVGEVRQTFGLAYRTAMALTEIGRAFAQHIQEGAPAGYDPRLDAMQREIDALEQAQRDAAVAFGGGM